MRDHRRTLYAGLTVFLATIVMGTVGYMNLEGASFIDALYMTVITVSTVGFGEIIPLSPVSRVFTIFVILMGAGAAAYTATQFLNYIIAGGIRRDIERKRMAKLLMRQHDHYVICGYGRMGRVITTELSRKKIPFVIIDERETYIQELDEKRYPYIIGDATKEDILIKAGIERAKGLICVVDADVENVYITLTARGMNKNLFIMSRCFADEAYTKLKWAGADKVISPYTTGAHSIANAILKPNVSEFLEVALGSGDYNIEVEEFTIHSGMLFCDKRLMDSNIRNFGIIVIAVRKSDGTFLYNPGPETVMCDGDTLIALGRAEDFEHLKKAHERG